MQLKPAFLTLVSVQALHSVEEYVGRLYDVFAPARLVSGMIADDPRRGFILFNVALVAFGFGCYFFPVRREWPSAAAFAWLWVAIELVNGIGHPAWSIAQGGYTPGVATALVLLPLALVVAKRLVTHPPSIPSSRPSPSSRVSP